MWNGCLSSSGGCDSPQAQAVQYLLIKAQSFLTTQTITDHYKTVSPMLFSCLMLLSQVQSEESQKELTSPRIRCPQGSKVYGYHCYALFVTPRTWTQSEKACQKQPSGHLVSVLSGAEGSFVSASINSMVISYSTIWIGLHDHTGGSEASGDGWEWSSKDLMNYNAWERHPSYITNQGHCGSLSKTTGFLKWKGYNCDMKLPYVCKFRD
ncbi:LOW QUALITY PROTEIN: regenerating islet-derived protein 3-gamma-like [Carlito syrichta]|uniref:LOW QUALITY PROTEIN: regenerating islet-derived protein 3-gamma-like n=1 Tax=Carlito syrichta TaxID=1868482 RepID=A0A3Q0E929_CARSF|nr:LOW QUALITY PROTEIN: regenerating islet-derived protein 3-gamma-like [Carlito syrichta]